MNFNSDNWAGAHPAISENLARHSASLDAAYGASELDRSVERRFDEIFERKVGVFFVGTGTAANSLAVAAMNRPGGVVFCHRDAHLANDECGAPEYFSDGMRLHAVDSNAGKIKAPDFERELGRYRSDFIHAGQPAGATLTQSTEAGTIYRPEEIAEIASVCASRGIPLHMDGARFSNALVSAGTSPADLTWRQGVDMLSIGGTKNGCWCAEALVFFHREQALQMPYLRKRAAQLFSKSRFIAAQFEAWLRDDLWLQLATTANQAAAKLADAVTAKPGCRLAWPVEANAVFVVLPEILAADWRERGLNCYNWPIPNELENSMSKDETLLRLVTHFGTGENELEAFAALPGMSV